MPLTVIDGSDAFQNIRKNPFRSWSDRTDVDSRINPVCKPGFFPSFQVEPDDKIFTIGSCFARNIEKALAARGLDVVTRRIPEVDPTFSTAGSHILNNYGVPSILNELEWALLPGKAFDPDQNFHQLGDGNYRDIHLSVAPAPRQIVEARREAIREVVSRVVECRIVVITLGLSEIWFDNETGTYINASVPRSLIAKYPGRFQIHVMSYPETYACLKRVIDLLREKCGPEQRVLLSVSPVPLTATFRSMDVVQANCYSKSVLRTAAEEIITQYDHIDYYPSCESITTSDASAAWEDDNVHVQRSLIDVNVERMIGAYVRRGEGAAPTLDELSEAMKKAYVDSQTDPVLAVGRLEPYRDFLHLDPAFAIFYVETCQRVGRLDDALAAVAAVPEADREWRRNLILADIELRAGRKAQGIEILERLVAEEPTRQGVYGRLVDAHMAEQNWDRALAVAQPWAVLARGSGTPFRKVAEIQVARGDLSGADKAHRAAIDRQPAYSIWSMDYAEFLIGQSRFKEAARVLSRAVPENAALALRFERLKVFVPDMEAEDGSAGGLFFNEEMLANARSSKARVASEKQELAEAARLFRAGDDNGVIRVTQGLANSPLRRQALRLQSRALIRMGLFEQVEPILTEMTESGEVDAATFGDLSTTMVKLGRPDEALVAARKAVDLDPDNSAWRVRVVTALMETGDIDAAEADLEKGIARDPQSSALASMKKKIESARRRNPGGINAAA